MAERRMFAKTIIDSDAFLDMPSSTQALYFHLSMRADDEGFINKPKTIMRMCNCTTDDMKLLAAKKFIIPFESGVVVIKHWKIHNYIAKDRFTETKYKEERSMLALDENSSYTECIQSVDSCETQVRLGKDRLGKVSIGKVSIGIEADKPPRATRFIPPTVSEVKNYCLERQNNVDPEHFVAYYESNGWKVGKNKMKNWKMAVVSWEKNGYSNSSRKQEEKHGTDILLDMLREEQGND